MRRTACARGGAAHVMTAAFLACLSSLLIGFATLRYRDFSYWWRWARGPSVAGFLALGVTFAAGGLAGLGLIHGLLDAGQGTGAALAQGAAGHAALRTQLGRIGAGGAGSPTLLGLLNDRATEFLDLRAERGATGWLGRRDDPTLRRTSLDLFWLSGAPDEGAEAILHQGLLRASEALDSDDPTTEADARGRLRGFCRGRILAGRLIEGDWT